MAPHKISRKVILALRKNKSSGWASSFEHMQKRASELPEKPRQRIQRGGHA
jgi:hypothetical protein